MVWPLDVTMAACSPSINEFGHGLGRLISVECVKERGGTGGRYALWADEDVDINARTSVAEDMRGEKKMECKKDLKGKVD